MEIDQIKRNIKSNSFKITLKFRLFQTNDYIIVKLSNNEIKCIFGLKLYKYLKFCSNISLIKDKFLLALGEVMTIWVKRGEKVCRLTAYT